MADKKIGELPKVTDLYSESLIPVEQQGKAMHMTGKQFSDFGKSVVQEYVEGAVEAAEQATASQEAAAKSASDAETSANTAKTHADAAKKSEDAAAASETNAENSAAAAKESQDAAKESADTASAGAQVVTASKAALDAVADNVDAIQNAASNAQKAQESADAAAEDAAKAEAAAKNAQSIAQGQKGYFGDPDALQKAVPEGQDGDWAIVGTTDTIWIWDADTGTWLNSGQHIDLSEYYDKKMVDEKLGQKQDKLTGAAGQVTGFGAVSNSKNAVPISGFVSGLNLIVQKNIRWINGNFNNEYYKGLPVYTGTNTESSGVVDLADYRGIEIKPDRDYTLSFYAKGNGSFRSYLHPMAVKYGLNSAGEYTAIEDGNLLHALQEDWERYVVVYHTRPDSEGTKNIIFMRLEHNTTAYICGLKFEEGSIATDWTPAPEDIQTELDGKQGKLTGTAGQVVGFDAGGNAQAVEVGGRNLLLNSGIPVTNGNYAICSYPLAEKPVVGDTYTLTIKCRMAEDRTNIEVYNSDGYVQLTTLYFRNAHEGIFTCTFPWVNEYKEYIADDSAVWLFVKPNSGTSQNTIYWAKLERGSVATDWTPAPEDIQTELTEQQQTLTTAMETAKAEALAKVLYLYAATLTVEGWDGSDDTGYTQTVSVTPQDSGPPVTADTQFDIPMVRHTGEQEADEAMDEALAIVNAGTVTPGAGTVTVKVWEKPETEITVFWYGR